MNKCLMLITLIVFFGCERMDFQETKLTLNLKSFFEADGNRQVWAHITSPSGDFYRSVYFYNESIDYEITLKNGDYIIYGLMSVPPETTGLGNYAFLAKKYFYEEVSLVGGSKLVEVEISNDPLLAPDFANQDFISDDYSLPSQLVIGTCTENPVTSRNCYPTSVYLGSVRSIKIQIFQKLDEADIWADTNKFFDQCVPIDQSGPGPQVFHTGVYLPVSEGLGFPLNWPVQILFFSDDSCEQEHPSPLWRNKYIGWGGNKTVQGEVSRSFPTPVSEKSVLLYFQHPKLALNSFCLDPQQCESGGCSSNRCQ